MTDLAHWDFATDFSGIEAAALIVGAEPTLLAPLGDGGFLPASINPVLARLKRCYEAARVSYLFSSGLSDDFQTSPELGETDLSSCRMIQFVCSDNETDFEKWLQDGEECSFSVQRFSRQEVSRWLSAIGLKSQYVFELPCDTPTSRQTNSNLHRWPWGPHHTELLGHLEAAAKRFWVNYDPAEPSTMDTNETVSRWLQSERRVSKTMADAIASILRLDGLQTGPRPR